MDANTDDVQPEGEHTVDCRIPPPLLNDVLFKKEEVLGDGCVSVRMHKMEINDVKLEQTQGATHILEIADRSHISIFSAAPACYYFHRFYVYQSMHDWPVQETAIASLLLSTNASQRAHFPVRTFTRVSFKKLLQNSHQIIHGVSLEEGSKLFEDLQNRVLVVQRLMLAVLDFNVAVSTFWDFVIVAHDAPYASYVFSVANTMLSSPICLLYPQKEIAYAIILKYEKERQDRNKPRIMDERIWEEVDMKMMQDILEEITKHINYLEDVSSKNSDCESCVLTMNEVRELHSESQRRRSTRGTNAPPHSPRRQSYSPRQQSTSLQQRRRRQSRGSRR
eukprot:m.18047 g.18047  ORF g.18047 m.18047 type:complete len:335 (+) comp4890_c0_seq1:2-1006(+)